MNKILILIAVFFAFNFQSNAQGVAINTTSAAADASAALDVQSTTQGMLVPRMTASQRGMIATPATGLLVYQTDGTAGFYFYNGTAWTSLSGGGSGDNLGNHTATTNLNMGGNNITAANNITATGTATLSGNTYPTTIGTDTQVLTTNGAGTLSWGNSIGAKMVLEATALLGQTISVGTNLADGSGTIRFDNEIVGPIDGTWANDTVYTVSVAGLYHIQAHVLVKNTGTNTSALCPYIETKDAGGAILHRLYSSCALSATVFPSASKGRGEVSGWINLSVGNTVRIKASNLSAASTAPISTSGSTRLTIVRF